MGVGPSALVSALGVGVGPSFSGFFLALPPLGQGLALHSLGLGLALPFRVWGWRFLLLSGGWSG